MRQRGIDPGAIRGSGPDGRIVEADVLRASAGSGDSAL
jgi:pyruvate/2-oxoglutarate dehydrogenase complex dihydrolipoamide acyltransferase (E2) component